MHVSCAQQPGSGWHLKLHETDDGSQVEVLCSQCDDVYLDCSGPKPCYKLAAPSSQPAMGGASTPYVSDAECAAAPFLFQDWCHGFNGGMRRACERLGGVCTGACDSDLAAREAYFVTFANQSPSLSNLAEMGEDPRVARASDIILCGFCCKPFSPVGTMHGFNDDRFGDNFDLMVASLRQRRDRGIIDPCLLCENVPNLLSFILPAQLALKNFGYHCKIYVVSGAHFRCANLRERVVYVLAAALRLLAPAMLMQIRLIASVLVSSASLLYRIVGFRDAQHLAKFSPPPPQSTTPTPIATILKPFERTSKLFLRRPGNGVDFKRCHVVTRNYPFGAHSMTSSYGSFSNPGTLIAFSPRFDAQTTKLTSQQLRALSSGEVRRLHPDELLASFSFRPHEMPRLRGNDAEQYAAVCQTVCVNVFEAFAAEALAAMGKSEPREQLKRSLPDWQHTTDASTFLESRVSHTGVTFEKYIALPSGGEDVFQEDRIVPMLAWNGII